MNEINWMVSIGGLVTKALAFAEAYNGRDYIIIANGEPGVMMIYPSKQYKNLITIGIHPLFAIKTTNVNNLVGKFADYVAPLQMESLSPIKSLYVRDDIFTRYYTEDGLMDRKIFDGTLEELHDLMEKNSWCLLAKDRCRQPEYIAETETCDVVVIECRKDFLGYPVFVTAYIVTTDGVIHENYGTPTGGADITTAITHFNRNVFDSQKYGCRYGQIIRVVDKEGNLYDFNPFE